MTFVDTNVIMYAVGLPHPLRDQSRKFFEDSFRNDTFLVTSVEVLQELLHAYIPVSRLATLEAAFTLIETSVREIWALEPEDIDFARRIITRYANLGARDLLHLACCKRREVTRIKTFDRKLAVQFKKF